MFGWLRRGSSQNSDAGRQFEDAAPTPDERRDELLSAYLDQDLNAADRAELDARLETDEELREALEGMRSVRDALASLEIVRAPRSFAIPAAEGAPRRGFRPVDLMARAGAMVAAVAFVAVLAGDLSDSGGPPVVQQDAATDLAAAAGDAGGGGGTEALSAPALGVSDQANDGGPASGGGEPESAPPPDAEMADPVEAATPAAPILEASSTVEATEGTAARSSTAEPGDGAADSVPSSGASAASDGGTDDVAPPLAPNTGGDADPSAESTPPPAVEEGDATSVAPSSPPVELPSTAADAAVSDQADDAGGPTGAGTNVAESTLGTQPDAPAVDETIVAPEAGREVSNLAIGLGIATAGLAAVSGLLWWRRRASVTHSA